MDPKKQISGWGIKDPNGNLSFVIASDEFSAWVVLRAVGNLDPIKCQAEGWKAVPVTLSGLE